MKRYLLIIGAILLGLSVRAQSVTYTCRYWFDKDHGQAVTTTFSESIWQEELDVGSLSDGLHTLHLQARDTSMRWSAPENFLFLKVSNIPTEQMPYIYWFDRDLANKQSGSLGNGQLFLDVDNLEAGLHTLHLMLNGTENSAVQNFLFLKVDAMGPDGESYIYHCWFDRDLANQQTDNLGTGHILLDVSGLTEGMHTVNVILEGSTFSATESYLFVKVPPVENVSQLTCHYWFDRDFANHVTDSLGTGNLLVDVNGLTDGLHTLHVILEGTDLAATESYMFVKIAVQEPEQELQYNCWFDEDYNTLLTGSVGNGIFLVPVGMLPVGDHNLYMQVNDGTLSSPAVYPFYRTPMITITINPLETGLATSSLVDDTICTLVAVPNVGYEFQSWTQNGEVISTDPEYTFTLLEDAEFVANFVLKSYDIAATANPADGGTVEGGGVYFHFSTCTMTATANTGYHFLNWTQDGVVVSDEPTFSFEVEGPASYVANFELNSYEIIAFADPDEVGTVTGEGIYEHFSECTLTAVAATGYHFVNWTKEDEVVSTTATYTFTVEDPGEYVAHFEVNTYDITATADPTEGGTVEGDGIYEHFSECTLIATANDTYAFVNWTINGEVVSTDAEYTFTVTGPAAYVAHFSMNTFEIMAIADPAEGGTVSGSGTYAQNATATLTATPSTAYHFLNWTDMNDEVVSLEMTYSFTVTESAEFVAHFELNSYEIVAMADPEEGGIVEGAGIYTHGEQAQLEAIPNEGYVFIGWMEDGEIITTTPNYGFTVTQPRILVASFELETYEIAAFASPEEGGIVEGAGTYAMGETCTLTATANEGYYFLHWVDMESEIVSYDMEYSFTVTEGATYYAMFELDVFEILAFADPEEGGTVTGAGFYNHGQNCTLTAVPNEGYLFVNWTRENEVVSEEETYSFVVTGNAEFVANFEATGGEITQASTFVNGWTWWSTCIETAEADVLGQLKTGLGNSGQVIKSQTASTMHLGNNWVGSLTMTNENGYMVKSNAEVTVDITGPAATPEVHPITLNPGWTWIGYPSTETMTVAAALANHTPHPNDVIKGQSVSAMFMAGAWRGALTLTPGMGLMYKSNSSEVVSFTYATPNRMTEAEAIAVEPHWNADYSAYPTNMTVLAVVELNGEELNSENYELSAFANGECRGSVAMMYVEPLDRYMALLTISGEVADNLHFGLYNTETGEECFATDETLTYETDAVIGSPDEPFVIRFRNTTGMDEWANSLQVFPNPVEHGQTITFGMADDMGVVQVEIVNALGTVVETLRATSLQNVIVPNTAGVYTLRITVEGKGVCYRKLVVR